MCASYRAYGSRISVTRTLLLITAWMCAVPMHAQLHVYEREKDLPKFMENAGFWVEWSPGVGSISSADYNVTADLAVALHVKPLSADGPIVGLRYTMLPGYPGAVFVDLRAELFLTRSRSQAIVAGFGAGRLAYSSQSAQYYWENQRAVLFPLSVRLLLPFINGGVISIHSCLGIGTKISYYGLNVGLWIGSKTYP